MAKKESEDFLLAEIKMLECQMNNLWLETDI